MTFHYRDWGGSGTPFLLLHGLASTSHIFDLVAPLLAADFRVIAFDQRGHGQSAKPDDGYDFENVGEDLHLLLDTLNFQAALLAGHSWGGNVALAFAVDHPSRVAALVLIDGGFLDIQSDPQMTWERTARELAPPHLSGMPVDEFTQRIKGFTGRTWTPAVQDVILANFEILPDRTIRPRLSHEHHMQILRSLWEQRPPQLYGRVSCPVLLLPAAQSGEDERAAAFLARKRANVALAERSLKQGETVWFEDTIHDVPIQRPQDLAGAIATFARRHQLL